MSQLKQAIEQGYVIANKGARIIKELSHWCNENHQPLIYGAKQGKFTRVEMALFFVPRASSPGADEPNRLNELSLEKVRTIYDYVASPRARCYCGTNFIQIDSADNDQAEHVAQAFLAIYKRNQGIDARIPAFTPRPDSPTYAHMEEAKKRHYIITHGIRDAFHIRWQQFCEAYALPYIEVNERRKGHAKVEVSLAGETTFTEALAQQIKRDAAQLGILDDYHNISEIRRNQGRYYSLHSNRVSMVQTMPIDTAIPFAEAIARALVDAGYFHDNHAVSKILQE